MTKNAARGTIVLIIILALFSVIAFAAPFARTAVFYLGYGFGVFAILVQFYFFSSSFSGSDARSRFYGFPIARVGVIYLAVQLAVSLVEFAAAKVLPMWVALIVNAILAALALIGCIAVETARDEVVRQDVQVRKDVTAMRDLQSLAGTLTAQCGDEELKPMLKELAEALRYSDPVSSEATKEIEGAMKVRMESLRLALNEGNAEEAKKLCERVKKDLAERNRICSMSK